MSSNKSGIPDDHKWFTNGDRQYLGQVHYCTKYFSSPDTKSFYEEPHDLIDLSGPNIAVSCYNYVIGVENQYQWVMAAVTEK